MLRDEHLMEPGVIFEQLWGMSKGVNHWSEADQQELFDKYFTSAPGICPVCSEEVRMIMTGLGKSVTLLIVCDGCGNKAKVNRMLACH